MDEILYASISQKALIEVDGKVLISRDKDDPKWELPGGRLNKGEKPEPAFKREVMEELGVDVEILSIFTTNITTDGNGGEKFFLVYMCKLLEGGDSLKPQNEVEELRWVGKDDLSKLPFHEGFAEVLAKFFNQPKNNS